MIRHPKDVTSKAELVQFLEELRVDLMQNPDKWGNPTLELYLEARPTSSPAESCSFLGGVLTAARVYE